MRGERQTNKRLGGWQVGKLKEKRSKAKAENSHNVQNSVMPAKAGIQKYLKTLVSRLRGNDIKGRNKTFYETIKAES